ncbi:uncharacterized protein LY79DRAFT_582457 [Colletotrichum navitas]|uniref:Uncharacterized protein n=1 Tax=Colletotrichum navitas TaxID=681940 RepID=A0AAD8PT29_9PEZI|nr:uncharacterized protein LY79DRAFT_582457 [Colletotrichum navitas]KAK1579523.1 hypothetical protein LY79DRAFT_582457 [Colletotrichum navitas]
MADSWHRTDAAKRFGLAHRVIIVARMWFLSLGSWGNDYDRPVGMTWRDMAGNAGARLQASILIPQFNSAPLSSAPHRPTDKWRRIQQHQRPCLILIIRKIADAGRGR